MTKSKGNSTTARKSGVRAADSFQVHGEAPENTTASGASSPVSKPTPPAVPVKEATPTRPTGGKMGLDPASEQFTEHTAQMVWDLGAEAGKAIHDRMTELGLNQQKFAEVMGVTPGRLAQFFSNPGNFRIETVVRLALALGTKVAVIVYDDDDPHNAFGSLPNEIFLKSWEAAGNPKRLIDVERSLEDRQITIDVQDLAHAQVFELVG